MIVTHELRKEYRSGRGRVAALGGVSLTVETGAVVAVVGKSGSGKTTLLNCIGGLERPDAGTVTCFGVEIHSLSAEKLSLFLRHNAGFVFQRGNLLSYLTVHENVAFPLALTGMRAPERDRRVEELLCRIGLEGAGKAMAHELSGGEMQRVSVARAIAHFPRMLLADEPTASLDSATAGDVVRLMTELSREQRCTMLLSTHDLDLVKLADAAIEIRDGRIVPDA